MPRRPLLIALLVLALPLQVGADEPLATVLVGREVPSTPSKRDPGTRFLAWGGEGDRYIGVGADGPVLLDLAGSEPRALDCAEEEGDTIVEGSVSPDKHLGGVLLSSGRVCLWDIEGNTTELGYHGRHIAHFALGVDTVALGYEDGRVEVREARSGKRVWQRNIRIGAVTMLRFNARGDRLVLSADKRGAAILDPRSGRLIRAFGREPAYAIAFDPTNERVAAGLEGGRVSVFDTRTGQTAPPLQLQGGRVVDLDFTSDGGQLAVATWKGTGTEAGTLLTVWDYTVEDEVFRVDGPGGAAPARFRYSPHGMELIADNGVGWTRYWIRPETPWRPFGRSLVNAPFGRYFDDWNPAPTLPPLAPPPLVGRAEGAFAIAPDGAHALARQAGAVVLVTLADGAAVPVGGAAVDSTFEWSGDGKQLLELTRDGVLTFRDAVTAEARARLTVGPASGLDFARGRLAGIDSAGRLVTAAGGEKQLTPVTTERVTAVAVDPAKPERLAYGDATGEVRVRGVGARGTISASGAAAERSFVLGAREVTAVAFSANGKLLAAAARRLVGPDGKDPGGVVTVFAQDADVDETPPAVVLDHAPDRIAFVGEGRYILAVSAFEVSLLDARTGALKLDLHQPVVDARLVGESVEVLDPEGAVRRIAIPARSPAWVPRGTLLAVSDDQQRGIVVDGDVAELWDAAQALRMARFSPVGEQIRTVALDPNATIMALEYASGDVETWSARTGEIQRRFHPTVDPAGPALPLVTFSEDGKLVWGGAGPRRLECWDAATGALKETVVVPGEGALVPLPNPWYQRIVALAPAAGGDPVAWVDVGRDAARRLYLAEDGRRPVGVAANQPTVALVREGELSTHNAALALLKLRTLRAPGFSPLGAADFTSEATFLAATATDGTVKVWDAYGKLAATEPTDGPAINGRTGGALRAVRFSESDGLLWTIDDGGWIRRWTWRTGAEIPQLPLAPGAVRQAGGISVALLSPDRSRVYSGHADGLVRAFDARTGFEVGVYADHSGPVTALAIAPDAPRMISAAEDGTIRYLNTADMHEVGVAPVFTDGVDVLAITADASRFAALGRDHVVRTWATGPTHALRRWALAQRPGKVELAFAGAKLVVRWEDGTTVWLDPDTGAVSAEALGAPPVWPVPATLPAELASVAAWPSAPRFVLPVDDHLVWTVAADDRLRLWDPGERALVATLTALTDGAWVLDRADGNQISSPSLRDGTATATQVFKPGDL